MKRSLLLLALFLFTLSVWAERIDVATARKVAATVATLHSEGLRSDDNDFSLVYAAAPGKNYSVLRSGTVEGSADYFVFNFPHNRGFAIVAGDDRVYPVLGYSEEGYFDPDNLPDNLRSMLAFYQNQITWAIDKGMDQSADVQAEWGRYLSGSLRSTGKSVLLETAHWSQNDPYNRQTPLISGRHAVTGCVATATAIIMRYHKHPTEVVTNGVINYWQQPVTYAPYDWDNMPLDYSRGYSDEQANAVAALMWNIGANVEMQYALNGSGAVSQKAIKALKEVFDYSSEARYLFKKDYRWDEWKSLVRKELDDNRPVFYDGTNNDGGHAFVCDGYKEGEAFHINWGWGNSHGWYLLTALDAEGDNNLYNQDINMGIGIRPAKTGDAQVYELRYISLSGIPSATNSFEVSANITNVGSVTFNGLWNIAVVDDGTGTIRCISNEQKVHLQEGYHYKYEQSFTCQATTLTEGQRILPVYSIDNGQTWKVMSGGASTPLYIGANGPVSSEPDEPNDPDVRPINVSIPWNDLVGYKTINKQNKEQIGFKLVNTVQDIVLRFKFESTKKDALTITYGEDWSTCTNPVSFNEDGSFTIIVHPNEIVDGDYSPYFQVTSTETGEFTYDIQIFAASDQTFTNPLFEQVGNKITFIDLVKGSIEPSPIVGTVGEAISFAFKIDPNLDLSLNGKQTSIQLNMQRFYKKDIELYYVTESGTEQLVELNESIYDGGVSLYPTDRLNIGKLQPNKEFRFKLLCKALPMQGSYEPCIDISISDIEGSDIFPFNATASISISESVKPVYYNIVKTLTNITTESSITQIKQGDDLSLTLVAEQGYSLPTSIEVKVNGTTLGAIDYTYDSSSGSLYIASGKIIGNVEIIATAVKTVVTYKVDGSGIKNLTITGQPLPQTINEGETLNFTLAAAQGFDLPASITITMGGKEMTNGYTYNKQTGAVSIQNVTGDLVIKAEGVQLFTVNALLGEAGLKIENLPASIHTGESLSVTLSTTGANYKLPKTISVTMGGKEVANAYHAETGAITIERVTGNIVITAKAIRLYQVTSTLSNLTVNPALPSNVEENASLSFTLQVAEGYKLPETISVSMGGRLLTAGTGYTYENGQVKIDAITGDVVITASAVEIPVYTVTYTLSNLNANSQVTSVKEGETLTLTLQPVNSNYKLPSSITVKVEGTTADYTYEVTSGKVTIRSIKGNVEIIANAIDDSHCEVTLTPTVGLNPIHIEPIIKNGKLEVTLTVAEGYLLPETIAVTMGGAPLEASSYTYTNGTLTIANVTGAVTITATPVKKQYDVTMELTRLTSNNQSKKVAHGDTYSFTLSVVNVADDRLPSTMTVTMGSRTLIQGTDYTYTKATGEVSIKNVTDAIKVQATAEVIPTYEVELKLTHLTSNLGATKPVVKEGKTFTVQLQPAEGYNLPASITVTDDKSQSVPFTYDAKTGTVSVDNVKSKLVVTATAVLIPSYTVTCQLTHLISDWKEGTTILEGKNLTCTLTPMEGYALPQTVTVTVGGITKNNVYDKATGKITVTNVTGPVVITAAGVDKRNCSVTWNLSHVSATPKPTVVLLNSVMNITFKAAADYQLPAAITVVMDGKTLSAGADYSYSSETGKFTLAKVTGPLVITVRGKAIPAPTPDPEPEPTPTIYRVTLPVVEGAEIVAETKTQVEEGDNFIFTITLKEGYKLSVPVVKANGKEIIPDSNGRYVIKNVRQNLLITVTGVKPDKPTANEELESNAVKVWGNQGVLHIETTTPETAYIITYDGRVYQVVNLLGGHYEVVLPQGAYLIRLGGKSYKVQL